MIIDFTVYVSLKFIGEYIFYADTFLVQIDYSLHTVSSGLRVAAYLYLADMFVILVTEGYITIRFPSSKQSLYPLLSISQRSLQFE